METVEQKLKFIIKNDYFYIKIMFFIKIIPFSLIKIKNGKIMKF